MDRARDPRQDSALVPPRKGTRPSAPPTHRAHSEQSGAPTPEAAPQTQTSEAPATRVATPEELTALTPHLGSPPPSSRPPAEAEEPLPAAAPVGNNWDTWISESDPQASDIHTTQPSSRFAYDGTRNLRDEGRIARLEEKCEAQDIRLRLQEKHIEKLRQRLHWGLFLAILIAVFSLFF